MGSGSLERASASLVPSIMSMRASKPNYAAILVCLNMTTPPLGKRNARNDRICPEYGLILAGNAGFAHGSHRAPQIIPHMLLLGYCTKVSTGLMTVAQ